MEQKEFKYLIQLSKQGCIHSEKQPTLQVTKCNSCEIKKVCLSLIIENDFKIAKKINNLKESGWLENSTKDYLTLDEIIAVSKTLLQYLSKEKIRILIGKENDKKN